MSVTERCEGLACIDLSQSTEKVVNKAAEIAKTLSAKLWLLHITEPNAQSLLSQLMNASKLNQLRKPPLFRV